MKLTIFIISFLMFNGIIMAQEGQSFHMDDLLEMAAREEGRYLRFIDNNKLSSGIYQLKVGDVDEQEPHQWDELYYVLEGEAMLRVNEEDHKAVPGSILFVAADVPHQFVEIKQDLKILVFFSKK